MKTAAIILAAGRGRRMGSSNPSGRAEKKAYLPLGGKPLMFYALKAFEGSRLVDAVILVVPRGDALRVKKEMVERFGFKKVSAVVPGGRERQDSVARGLKRVGEDVDIVVVHDSARPFATQRLIEETILCAKKYGSAIPCVTPKDTIKEKSGPFVKRTLERDALLAVQTPQAFRADILKKAYSKAKRDGILATDCSSLVERIGARVRVVEGSYENMKITTRDDLLVAERMVGRGKA